MYQINMFYPLNIYTMLYVNCISTSKKKNKNTEPIDWWLSEVWGWGMGKMGDGGQNWEFMR